MKSTAAASNPYEQGFTLIELLVMFALIALLFGLSAINLGRPQIAASLDSTLNVLLADIKSQQAASMLGDNGGTSSQQPHGLYLQSTTFTLFAGSSYNHADSHNFTETVASGVSLATTFPANTIMFDKGTGEVSSFANGSNTITLTDNGETRTVTLSRFGAVSVQ